MLRKKQRTFLIIALVVLLVLILGLVYYFYSQPDSVSQQKDTSETTTQKKQPDQEIREATTETGTTQQEETAERQIEETTPETTAKQTARIFVERFASRSSQNDNQHLESIYSMVTEDMRSWAEEQTVEQTRDYSGQTTEVVASDVEKIQEDQATIIVQVQQTRTEDGEEKTLQKEGRVELIKEEGSWKVDGLYWE